jgi:hypothetical protein
LNQLKERAVCALDHLNSGKPKPNIASKKRMIEQKEKAVA